MSYYCNQNLFYEHFIGHCQRIVVPTITEIPLQRGYTIPCHKTFTTNAVTTNIKGKGKVCPCTGTEPLYRTYGP